MAKQSLPLPEVYQLIEPGPVVLVSSMMGEQTNIMTMSWHMMIEFEPPTLACAISAGDYTYDIVKKTKECVINIPTEELAKKVVGCGNTIGRDIDKFKQFGLTPSAAACVRAPLIDECYANFECKMIDSKLAAKYGIFIFEVVKAWIDRSQKNPRTIHHQGNGKFVVDGEIIRLPSRMK